MRLERFLLTRQAWHLCSLSSDAEGKLSTWEAVAASLQSYWKFLIQ